MEAEKDKSADKYRLAVSSLEDAIKYDRHDASAHILLARVYLKLGDRENARREAEYVIRAASDPATVGNAESILKAINRNP
jgi:Tfp pilus assembly protein PilF